MLVGRGRGFAVEDIQLPLFEHTGTVYPFGDSHSAPFYTDSLIKYQNFPYKIQNLQKNLPILSKRQSLNHPQTNQLPINPPPTTFSFIAMTQLIFRFNFKMEETNTLKEKVFQPQRIDASVTPQHSCSSLKERSGRRGKKDNLKQKKKLKNAEKEEGKPALPEHGHHLLKNKSDQDNSVTTHDSTTPKNKTPIPFPQPLSAQLLHKLISRPPYVTVSNSHRIFGDYGHSSAIFKRPILEGNYFLEVMVKQDVKKQKKTSYKSSLRIGICHHAYNCSFPLGCEESIAYKSCDGSFVKHGEKIEKGEAFTVNDVIGVLMKISPPRKYPNQNEVNEDSTVSFFKNGKLMFEFKQLKQVFYCFAVSFFNYSQVQVLQGPDSRYPMGQAQHYYSILNQQILYKEFAGNKIFKV